MNKKTNSDLINNYTDNYFLKTKKIIQKYGDINVTYAIFIRRPGIIALKLAINWIKQISKDRGIKVKYAHGIKYSDGVQLCKSITTEFGAFGSEDNTKYITYFNINFIRMIFSNEYIGIVFLEKYKYYNSKSKDKIIKIIKLPTKNINEIKLYMKKYIST